LSRISIPKFFSTNKGSKLFLSSGQADPGDKTSVSSLIMSFYFDYKVAIFFNEFLLPNPASLVEYSNALSYVTPKG
tara:strand:+ start:856 stop:1083 length:228 start_codon:yes stop_codon:yes gene_type:complete